MASYMAAKVAGAGSFGQLTMTVEEVANIPAGITFADAGQ
jgi:hypothetical protein